MKENSQILEFHQLLENNDNCHNELLTDHVENRYELYDTKL